MSKVFSTALVLVGMNFLVFTIALGNPPHQERNLNSKVRAIAKAGSAKKNCTLEEFKEINQGNISLVDLSGIGYTDMGFLKRIRGPQTVDLGDGKEYFSLELWFSPFLFGGDVIILYFAKESDAKIVFDQLLEKSGKKGKEYKLMGRITAPDDGVAKDIQEKITSDEGDPCYQDKYVTAYVVNPDIFKFGEDIKSAKTLMKSFLVSGNENWGRIEARKANVSHEPTLMSYVPILGKKSEDQFWESIRNDYPYGRQALTAFAPPDRTFSGAFNWEGFKEVLKKYAFYLLEEGTMERHLATLMFQMDTNQRKRFLADSGDYKEALNKNYEKMRTWSEEYYQDLIKNEDKISKYNLWPKYQYLMNLYADTVIEIAKKHRLDEDLSLGTFYQMHEVAVYNKILPVSGIAKNVSEGEYQTQISNQERNISKSMESRKMDGDKIKVVKLSLDAPKLRDYYRLNSDRAHFNGTYFYNHDPNTVVVMDLNSSDANPDRLFSAGPVIYEGNDAPVVSQSWINALKLKDTRSRYRALRSYLTQFADKAIE